MVMQYNSIFFKISTNRQGIPTETPIKWTKYEFDYEVSLRLSCPIYTEAWLSQN